MSPPPRYLITRKLVGKFFQNYLPKEPIYAQDEKAKLVDCWFTNGYDHPKCRELEAKYDWSVEDARKYRERLESLNFRQTVMSTLTTPKFKHDIKGRERKPAIFKPHTIFHGVK